MNYFITVHVVLRPKICSNLWVVVRAVCTGWPIGCPFLPHPTSRQCCECKWSITSHLHTLLFAKQKPNNIFEILVLFLPHDNSFSFKILYSILSDISLFAVQADRWKSPILIPHLCFANRSGDNTGKGIWKGVEVGQGESVREGGKWCECLLRTYYRCQASKQDCNKVYSFTISQYTSLVEVVAQWLRRWTRNLGSGVPKALVRCKSILSIHIASGHLAVMGA